MHEIIEQLNELINETLPQNPQINSSQPLLNDLTDEQIAEVLQGDPNNEDDYWKIEESFFKKVLKYIRELEDHYFDIRYSDSEGSSQNQTALQLLIKDGLVSGYVNIYDSGVTKIYAKTMYNTDQPDDKFELIADSFTFLYELKKKLK